MIDDRTDDIKLLDELLELQKKVDQLLTNKALKVNRDLLLFAQGISVDVAHLYQSVGDAMISDPNKVPRS